MITSKLTSKAQATIPQPVRSALQLRDGDDLAYAIEDDRVILTRVRRSGQDDPFATFDEWDSEADRKPMPILEQGGVVRVPFPYTDGTAGQSRTALVVSAGPVGAPGHLICVSMITSAVHRQWPGDIAFGDMFSTSGLPAPSVVRTAKFATLDAARARLLGRAPPAIVRDALQRIANTWRSQARRDLASPGHLENPGA